jgi:pimeloyl-ACP methyl ester carboxylesterase
MFLSVALLALVIYAGLCIYIYNIQRSLLYFPVPESEHLGAVALHMEAEGERLKLWKLGREDPGAPAIIYFGGNAEDVALNIPSFSEWLEDYTVYLVNYRGYGGSSGQPTEQGLFADALAVYDQLSGRHESVSLIGRSLGSGVAIYVSSKREIQRLVLITPYDSIENIARKLFPFLPIKLLLRDKFQSVKRVKDIAAPVLILSAEFDEVIPRANTDALAAALAPEQTKMVVIKAAGHNNIGAYPEFGQQLGAFL